MKFIIFALTFFLAPIALLADSRGVDQESARLAVQSGQIMPLEDILSKVNRNFQGKILEVILKDQEEGMHGWVYDIKIFTKENDDIMLRVDAGTGTVLKVEGKMSP